MYNFPFFIFVSSNCTQHILLVPCSGLLNPNNGSVDIDGLHATYTCFAGFDMEGEKGRVFQENGTWTGQEPNCTCKSNSQTGLP